MLRTKFAIIFIVLITIFTYSCSNATANTNQTTINNVANEAKEVVDRFMQAFCRLDLKEMADETDAQIDFSNQYFISLEDLKSRMLVPFSPFKALGVPMEEFDIVTDEIFDSYENYSSYSIIDSKEVGNNVEFTVNVEYISLTTMSGIIKTAIQKIDMTTLESQLEIAMVASGLKIAIGKGSVSDVVKAVVAPIIDNLKIEITRSIKELNPQKGTVKLVVYQVNNEWVISDSMSDISFLNGAF